MTPTPKIEATNREDLAACRSPRARLSRRRQRMALVVLARPTSLKLPAETAPYAKAISTINAVQLSKTEN
jgi:hypothetical protein